MRKREPKFTLKEDVYVLKPGIYKLHKPLHEYLPVKSKILIHYSKLYFYKGSMYPMAIQEDEFLTGSKIDNCTLHIGRNVWRQYCKETGNEPYIPINLIELS